MDPYFQYFRSNLFYNCQLDLPELIEHAWLITLSFQSTTAITHNSQLSIPNSIFYYDVTERSRFSYPRVTANRFDLTLQGRPNQHDTCNPVGPHASTVSIVTTTSEMRLLKPRCWAPHGELPENPKVASIQHPPTPMPTVAGRDSKYRCKVVHSLPVSTTSYFRHVVSTVQSSISSANNGTVLNRHRRRLTFLTFLIHNQNPLRPVSIFPFLPQAIKP